MASMTKLLAPALAAATLLGMAAPAPAAGLGTGAAQLAPAAAEVIKVGYWYRGRWYGGCWNCGPPSGAAVGAGIALGILGGAAIAGAVAAPPPPPPTVYYQQPPTVYLEPAPGRCWVQTDPRGYGYWSPC